MKILGLKCLNAAVALLFSLCGTAYAENLDDKANAYSAAVKWLNLWDTGDYDSSWSSASVFFKADVAKTDAKRVYREFRLPSGNLISRWIMSSEFNKAPDGEYFDFVFNSDFRNNHFATEIIEMVRESDGAWKVSTWSIR